MWNYGEQDGGAGCPGTVVTVHPATRTRLPHRNGFAWVLWDAAGPHGEPTLHVAGNESQYAIQLDPFTSENKGRWLCNLGGTAEDYSGEGTEVTSSANPSAHCAIPMLDLHALLLPPILTIVSERVGLQLACVHVHSSTCTEARTDYFYNHAM